MSKLLFGIDNKAFEIDICNTDFKSDKHKKDNNLISTNTEVTNCDAITFNNTNNDFETLDSDLGDKTRQDFINSERRDVQCDNEDNSKNEENREIKITNSLSDDIVLPCIGNDFLISEQFHIEHDEVHKINDIDRAYIKLNVREISEAEQESPKSIGVPLCEQPATDLSASQYSLVSTEELTVEALQEWMKLPTPIICDPDMHRYEKQIANRRYSVPLNKRNSTAPESRRMSLVKSIPHLKTHRVADENEVKLHGYLGSDEDNRLKNEKASKSKFACGMYYLKMTLLLVSWVFLTLVFMFYCEKKVTTRYSSISPGEIKNFVLNITDGDPRILAKITGPILTEQAVEKLNNSQVDDSLKILLWLEYWASDVISDQNISSQISHKKALILQDGDLDFNPCESRSVVLNLKPMELYHNGSFVLRMSSTANQPAPFSFTYTVNPIESAIGALYSCVLLCALYFLIIFEVINRTMAAVIVSMASLAVLALIGERPSLPELVSWLDTETLLLLFSMMILVAIMAETGMFDFLAVLTFEVTKGKLWPLITLLCAITALLSTLLDNVTTVLLMAPVTIRLCEVMELDPVPILMSMVLFSNIGGTATPVGDPPNVIIASNKAVVQMGINFTNFTMHMMLGILLVCVQTYFQLRYMYRDTNTLRLNDPKEVQDLRHQITIWRRAIESLPILSRDQQIVRKRLERQMRKMGVQLEKEIQESKKRVCPRETFQNTLEHLKGKYKIRDKYLLLKSTVAISFVVAIFFLHSIPELSRISLGWTALLGAILLLILADREDLEPILRHVEWSTLLFFAALFILMEALSKLGLIEFIGDVTESFILAVDEKNRLTVAILLLLWVSGLSSAFIDNIPLTTMMIRVVIDLGSNPNLNLPMAPLIWALSFGVCLGGNGTLIGASANVVCAGVAEQHGYRISFVQFFKVGFPLMIGHLIVASAYLLFCHCVFAWH